MTNKATVPHQDVGTEILAVIPPRRVPLGKRLFWRSLLWLLRSRRGRAWIVSRYATTRGG